MSIRIGQGFDAHRFISGRKLVLGGVDIQTDIGLEGHSDADVLLHAIADATLGALALGDIGKWFPPTDEIRGMKSTILVKRILESEHLKEWKLVNLDSTIIAQIPRLASLIPEMGQNISSLFGVEEGQVSVKATTTDKLGFTGRGEGIAAQAIVMLQRKME